MKTRFNSKAKGNSETSEEKSWESWGQSAGPKGQKKSVSLEMIVKTIS